MRPNWNRFGYDEEMLLEVVTKLMPKINVVTQQEYNELEAANKLETNALYFINEN